MSSIKQDLIKSIAIEENYSFLLDMNELMPEILNEIRSNLIQVHFKLQGKWQEYKFHRHEKEILILSKEAFNSPSFFRFCIYIGGGDSNMYFGITGPFHKESLIQIDEIKELKQILKNTSLIEWSGFNMKWFYKYFGTNRNTLFNSLKNGEDIKLAITPFAEEFFGTFSEQLDLIDEINIKLAKL